MNDSGCCWIILGKLNEAYTAVEEYVLFAVGELQFARIPEQYVLCSEKALPFEKAQQFQTQMNLWLRFWFWEYIFILKLISQRNESEKVVVLRRLRDLSSALRRW